jgi:hypothetical protein
MRSHSQEQVTNDPPSYGPFNAVFLPDAYGLTKPLIKDDSVLWADLPGLSTAGRSLPKR